MCERFKVFSGCSGNLGKLFFCLSGTHRKDLRSECPIVLLGDLKYKIFKNQLALKGFSCLHMMRTLSPDDQVRVEQLPFLSKNSLDKAYNGDTFGIYIENR